MALARTRGPGRPVDYWPGFVDALSTLVLAIVFMLSVFVLAQFFLSQEITGKDTALQRLNRQVAELTDLLALERSAKKNIEDNAALLQSSLRALEAERARLQSAVEASAASGSAATARTSELATQLEGERQITSRAMAQVELLNQQI